MGAPLLAVFASVSLDPSGPFSCGTGRHLYRLMAKSGGLITLSLGHSSVQVEDLSYPEAGASHTCR